MVTVSGETLDRGTIVVDRGLITAIGVDVEPPAGAWVIEGAGLTVYPGLIDGLASLPLVMPPMPTGNDAPVARGPEDRPATTPWLRAADLLDSSSLDKWRRAGFSAAAVAPREGIVAGQAALVNLAGDADAYGRGSAVVADRIALRLDTRTNGPTWRGFPSSLMGTEAYLRQLFLDARYFLTATRRYEADPLGLRRPGYDRTLRPLAEMIEDGTPILLPARSRIEIQRAVTLAKALESRPILYGGQEAFDATAALASTRATVLVALDWPAAAKDPDPDAHETMRALRLRARAPETPAALREAGVRFAFATEALDDPAGALEAVKKAVDAGLARDAAVRALTLDAAAIYGVDDRLGSLDPGKIANLLVTAGELFTEGVLLDRVVVDGRIFDLDRDSSAAADTQLETTPAIEVADTAAETPPPSAPASEPSADEKHAVTLVRNATILTITDGEIANGEILIRDGRIAGVGRSLRAPDRARVIDAGGGFVMPGIIDCHSHIAVDGGVNEGSIAVSSMAAIEEVLDPGDPNIYRALAGGVTTANVLHGSANPIGGTNAVIKLRWGTDAEGLLFEGAPPGIKFAMGENPKRSNSTHARRPGPPLSGDAHGCARRDPAGVHRGAGLPGGVAPLRRGAQGSREEEGRPVAHSPAARPAARAAGRGARRKTPGARALLPRRRDPRADASRRRARLPDQDAPARARGLSRRRRDRAHGAGASTFSDRWAYKIEAWEAIPYNAALLTERGVVVSINSDSAEEMRHLNQEAAKAMKWGGLSETEALKLVTLNPALQLGIADRVGSIEKGKDADLVIYDRHPLSIYAVVQKTIVDGEVMFDRALDLERRPSLEAEKLELERKLAGAAKDGAGDLAVGAEGERKPPTGARR